MKKFLLLFLIFASTLYMAGYVELSAGVRSGPIVINSMGDEDVYVFVSPDDGNLKMFGLKDIDKALSPVWKETLVGVSGGIPSTGGHAYYDGNPASKTNFIFLAPKGYGLVGFYFGTDTTSSSGAFDNANAIFSDWDNILGGIAVLTATQDSNYATVIVVGLDEEGYLRAAYFKITGSGDVLDTV